jgi:N-acetylglutamate synthase-like GNAT family acetyltransferase
VNNPGSRVRPATDDDQPLIRRVVRRTLLDPTVLHWSRFVLVERDGEVVGVGQIRPRTPELDSLVVRRDMRGQGIGTLLVEALLATHSGPVYLECAARLTSYYARFGFEEIRWQDAPMPLKLKAGLANVVDRLFGIHFATMKRGDG